MMDMMMMMMGRMEGMGTDWIGSIAKALMMGNL
jgi:hypothetical protein